MIKVLCFSCHKELTFGESVGRREECLYCGSDVHVCRNCRHYDPKVYNECREPQAEVIRERDRSNFCDFFAVRLGGLEGAVEDPAALARARAEALFKKS